MRTFALVGGASTLIGIVLTSGYEKPSTSSSSSNKFRPLF
jgi:hypothetical protein